MRFGLEICKLLALAGFEAGNLELIRVRVNSKRLSGLILRLNKLLFPYVNADVKTVTV